MASDGFLTHWLSRFSAAWAERRRARQQEKDLIREIDRIVSETKTKIHLVPNYRELLKKPLQAAAGEVSRMVARIPGPMAIDPGAWDREPVLRAVFNGPADFSEWLAGCPSLHKAFKTHASSELFGLLVTDYSEKSRFGVQQQGDVVLRDVKQYAVSFGDPRILVPAPDLTQARKELQHRLLVMLFTRELNEIADLKALQAELEKQQELLEFKLGWDEAPGPENSADSDEAEKLLSDIHREIEDIGEDVDSPQAQLTHVTQALTDIRRHLQMKNITLRLNQMGIKVDASSKEPFDEITLTECAFTGSSRRVAAWVGIKANKGGSS